MLLFVIFKARQNDSIARNLYRILLSGMHECVQEAGWMDNRFMSIWKEYLCYSYMQGTSRSGLLLDTMEIHIHCDFIDVVDKQERQVI